MRVKKGREKCERAKRRIVGKKVKKKKKVRK